MVLGADEGTDGLPVPSGMVDAERVMKELWDGLNNSQRTSANVLVNDDVRVETWEGSSIVLVNVPRADRRVRPVYVGINPKTGSYRRNGEGDYHVTEDELWAMGRDSLREPIDATVLDDLSLDDLCNETLQAYRNVFRNARPKNPWREFGDEAFLVKLGAAGRSKNDHAIHPTRAGLLMFGLAESIVLEFPHYFLDCRQELDGNRWNNRVFSGDGEWSGNVFDFWHKANRMLSEGLPVPFRLRPDMTRVDDTPQHRAVREALTNALVHADYFGRAGIVAVWKPESIEVSNPGVLRIPLDLIESGGISDARNETLLRMFSMVDIGERAGSGYDVLCEGTTSAGKPDPVYAEIFEPERVKLTMELETSGLVEFRLPGMGGESSPLITRIEPPRHADDGDISGDDGDISGDDGELTANELAIVDAVRELPKASRAALSERAHVPARTFDRTMKRLVNKGLIERVGSKKTGYWKIRE